MEIFLVGGAVRDQLLGLPVIERDWVVIGATPEQMLKLGFQPVGKEFPVFLHPETKEEYALARTERKIGKGYKGFLFYTHPDVTLTQDLARRDLTINAMAQTTQGDLIDPYGGQQDLSEHWLRHVSSAFSEDPVRILRIARFASRLPHFRVHPETLELMIKMVQAGETDALVAERVWQELKKSLTSEAPHRFWQILADCGALSILFPSIQLTEQNLLALRQAVVLTEKPEIRFAAFLHEMKLSDIKQLCQHYKIPNFFKELSLLVANYRQFPIQDAKSILDLLQKTDALRRSSRFSDFLLACEACGGAVSHHALLLQKALLVVRAIDTQSLVTRGLSGLAFAEALRDLQLAAIVDLIK